MQWRVLNLKDIKNCKSRKLSVNIQDYFKKRNFQPLAEREGFEPSVRLRVRSISNAVHSAALSPLRVSLMCEKQEVFSSLKHGNTIRYYVKKRIKKKTEEVHRKRCLIEI